MALSTIQTFFLDSNEDKTKFLQNIAYLKEHFGAMKPISDALNSINNVSSTILSPALKNISENDFTLLNEKVSYILGAAKKLNQTSSSDLQGKLGYLSLLASTVAFNFALKPMVVNEQNQNFLIKVISAAKNAYQFIDHYYLDGIQKDPYLKKLRTKVFNLYYSYFKLASNRQLLCHEIAFHIERKNKKAKLFGGRFNGFLISNNQSEHTSHIDPECLSKLYTEMQQLKLGNKPRTQFIVFAAGKIGHVLTFDVNYDQQKKQFEIISMESAEQILQWKILNALTEKLKTDSENYEILSIQCKIQKNYNGCPVYALSLANESSKLSFSEIKNGKYSKAQNIDEIRFYNGDSYLYLKDLSQLDNVTWLPVEALGLKAILIGQSTTEIQDKLAKLQYPDSEKIMKNWNKAYEVDVKNQKTYYDYHEYSLKMKFSNSPYGGLTLKSVLDKVKANPDEVVDEDLALRRLASGFSPYREMEYLVSELEKRNELERLSKKGGKQNLSPLHWSIIKGQESRACLLLSKGSTIDSAAKDYFEKSTFKKFKENPYLNERLKKS